MRARANALALSKSLRDDLPLRTIAEVQKQQLQFKRKGFGTEALLKLQHTLFVGSNLPMGRDGPCRPGQVHGTCCAVYGSMIQPVHLSVDGRE